MLTPQIQLENPAAKPLLFGNCFSPPTPAAALAPCQLFLSSHSTLYQGCSSPGPHSHVCEALQGFGNLVTGERWQHSLLVPCCQISGPTGSPTGQVIWSCLPDHISMHLDQGRVQPDQGSRQLDYGGVGLGPQTDPTQDLAHGARRFSTTALYH